MFLNPSATTNYQFVSTPLKSTKTVRDDVDADSPQSAPETDKTKSLVHDPSSSGRPVMKLSSRHTDAFLANRGIQFDTSAMPTDAQSGNMPSQTQQSQKLVASNAAGAAEATLRQSQEPKTGTGKRLASVIDLLTQAGMPEVAKALVPYKDNAEKDKNSTLNANQHKAIKAAMDNWTTASAKGETDPAGLEKAFQGLMSLPGQLSKLNAVGGGATLTADSIDTAAVAKIRNTPKRSKPPEAYGGAHLCVPTTAENLDAAGVASFGSTGSKYQNNTLNAIAMMVKGTEGKVWGSREGDLPSIEVDTDFGKIKVGQLSEKEYLRRRSLPANDPLKIGEGEVVAQNKHGKWTKSVGASGNDLGITVPGGIHNYQYNRGDIVYGNPGPIIVLVPLKSDSPKNSIISAKPIEPEPPISTAVLPSTDILSALATKTNNSAINVNLSQPLVEIADAAQ